MNAVGTFCLRVKLEYLRQPLAYRHHHTLDAVWPVVDYIVVEVIGVLCNHRVGVRILNAYLYVGVLVFSAGLFVAVDGVLADVYP